MSALAKRLDETLERLDPETAHRIERLVEDVLALASQKTAVSPENREIKLISKDLGVRPGIDIDKIGQLIEELDAKPLQ